ncbi:TonB-dependent receptor [Massilia sp. IC2-477]|uniref:TonB-dependent receptor plug domain-containing protein n=1 Tax=Massilia sp. IC2-477 TaxID=2887198 RepID=UPI001D0FB211|nr:TonB-dependent receptor [Massilia sp. IC2-477]MCC2954272.1 TonB-dependent receptor [Massilia sp. IC2-477]
MMETILSRSIRAICLGGMTLSMGAALAQDAAQPLQRVEVTGSRIRQVDLETAQPVQVMTSEQIQKTGLITVGDVLNQLSSAGSPDFSKGGSLTSNRENGGQYINLRNLGSNRLLVLVDGKRWTQTVDGYTDMSTVPASMIERIEVLKDGASSIYGSDAIAGVVNIILKKRLEGGNLSVYLGQNEKSDGKSKDFSLSFGANGEKTSLMFGLSHTEQGVVWAKTRPVTGFPRGPKYPTEGLGVGPWGEILPLDFSFDKVLNHTGGPLGDGVGQDSRNPANYHDWDGGPLDNFNSASQMMFAMPTKLDTIFTKGTVELPYGMRFQTTAMYSQRKSTAQVAGYPLNSESQPAFPVYIDKNSYYNPYGSSVVGAAAAQDLYFYRRTIEVPRVTENRNNTLHVDATLSGDFEFRSLPWNWDVGYNHSAVKGSLLGTGNVNLLNLKKALGPSFLNASGVVQCGTAAAPIALAECLPWNIIGGPSASNPDIMRYVMATGQASYGSTINSATANIGGEIYTLPAGAIGLAGGVEHREVKGYDLPGQFEQSGYSTDLAGNPTRGRYTVKEAYLELNVPLLKGVTMAELLSVNLATRHSDYSNFGVTNNSKASFMWKPMKDLLVRGTWAEGFRAPAVGDTFGGGQQTFDTYVDPCDSLYGATGDAAVAARCAAAGAGAGFRQLAQTGPITSGAGDQSPYPFVAGAGNSALTPETAITKTAGFVYSPSYVPGLTVALDWFNVKITNQITAITATEVAEYCYVDNLAPYCAALKRDPATGQIISLNRGNANKGALMTEGLDLSINYRLPRTQYGQFAVRSETSYVDKLRDQATTGAEWTDYAGQYFYNRVKSNLSLDWSLGNWNATWTTRYYSGVKDRCYKVNAEECSNIGGEASWGKNYNKLGSTSYTDLSVGYKTNWNGQIMVGVNNLFDKSPRLITTTAASSSRVDADYPIDRFFYVRYNQSF